MNRVEQGENDDQPADLEQLLDRLQQGADGCEEVSLRTMLEAVGPRSFAPVLLVAGLIMFSPLSGIPGLPTAAAMMVLLIAVQLLFGRRYFWIPSVLERRAVSRRRFDAMLRAMRPVARFIDHFLKPRLTVLTEGAGSFVIAVICVLVAISVPPLEVVPFLSTTAGAVLVLLSLALIAHDGLFALIAIAVIATVMGSILSYLI